MRGSVTGGALRRPDSGLVLLLVAVGVLHGPLFPELRADWFRSGDFSHGFLVPILSSWLLWQRRDAIWRAPARPSWTGALLLAGGILQYLVGVAASEFYLQRTSLVPVIGGWILLLWGPARARLCLFPVAFLLLMIPPPTLIWSTLSVPLQLVASRAAGGLLDVVGLEAVREGNVIHLDTCSLEVARACSGLRSLVTLLAVSALLAEGSLLRGRGPERTITKIALFLLAVPVTIGANGLRVAGTALAVSRFGPEAAEGGAHDAAGLVVFVISLAALFLGRRILAWIDTRRPSPSPAS
jgi:exosortase